MKKGWQLLKVFISKSRDFLNWVDNVGARFLVSEPIPMSSANNSWRNLFDEIWINWSRSALKVSRFFSRNPEKSQQIQVTSKKRKQFIMVTFINTTVKHNNLLNLIIGWLYVSFFGLHVSVILMTIIRFVTAKEIAMRST